MEPFITLSETMWELLSQAQGEGKQSSVFTEEGILYSLPCPSQFPLELPKGPFGCSEALVYLIQKDLSFSSPIMF